MENNANSAEAASVEAKTQDLPVQAQENKTKKAENAGLRSCGWHDCNSDDYCRLLYCAVFF
jgi:hypothetical protein